MPPAVTVLMGIYNGARHLRDSLASIQAQTLADFEFLIIDDASTDDSLSIVEAAAAGDARIRVLRNPVNEGLGAILHRGVREARAPIVARMDADDVAVPDRLRRQVQFLRDHPEVDVCGSYATDIDDEGRVLRERRVPVAHDDIVRLIWTCPLIHPTVAFRRDRILGVGSYLPSMRRRQDYELWFRCVRAGLGFANIPEPLLLYRYSTQTLRRNNLPAMWQQVLVGLKGCRLIGAPPLAYIGASMPLLDAMLPAWARMRLVRLKRRFDPRDRA